MGYIAAALQIYGAIADTLGIAQFIGGLLRKEGQSAEELFAVCFTRAVSRSRSKLAKLR